MVSTYKSYTSTLPCKCSPEDETLHCCERAREWLIVVDKFPKRDEYFEMYNSLRDALMSDNQTELMVESNEIQIDKDLD